MHKLIKIKFDAMALLAVTALAASTADGAAGLEQLQGKWSVAKTNDEGRRYSQVIEIKDDKLTFQLLDGDAQARFTAKGKIKAEKTGPFNVLTVSEIRAGRSADELEPVDDTRATVFALRDGKLILASNFDRERENEQPRAETYTRSEAAKEAPRADGEKRLLGTWKLDLTLGDRTMDYDLRFEQADGKLQATLISPRSGEYKAKSVAYKDGVLAVEVDRTIDGNEVTFVYQGKWSGEGLSGQFKVKGHEDQFSGQWKARK